MVTMKAKFQGRCKICQAPVNPGERIHWFAQGVVTHRRCGVLRRVGPSPIKVALSCSKDWISESRVKITDCSEDPFGRDVVTFTCPECGEVHNSLRVGRA